MKTIELFGDIDEHHRLRAEVPAELPAGPVRLIVLWPDEDEAGIVWPQGVAKEWADELQDPQQDIYTLEDGQPVNAQRSDPIPEVLVAYISSVIPTQPLASDLLIDPGKPEFRSTHLKTASALRLHKLATVHSSSLARYLGSIDSSTSVVVAKKLRDLLAL